MHLVLRSCLGAAAALLAASSTPASAAGRHVLTWPGPQNRAIGHGYVAGLVADTDINRHVLVLHLVVRRAGHGRDGNLVEPSGRWHGLEPMDFLPRDFASGAMLPQHRVLPIQGSRDAARVEVIEARPTSGSDWKGGRLTIRVDVEPRDRPAGHR